MYDRLSPKKTIILLTIILLSVAYFGIDYHYKTRSIDILSSVIFSSEELIAINNFAEFSSNLHSAMLRQPILKSIILYDNDYRKLIHYGTEFSFDKINIDFTVKNIVIYRVGLLKYALAYNFPSKQEFILVASFYDDSRLYALFFIFLTILVSFGSIYYLCNKFDIDNLNITAAHQAIGMLSLGFHEMKQYIAFTTEILKYIKTNKKNQLTETVFLKDFENISIGAESMMSILEINNFSHLEINDSYKKTNNNNICVEVLLNRLVSCYKKKNIVVELIFEHKSEFIFPKHIFFAIVGNLIKNAFFFSNRLVWITTKEKKGSIAISIANTGKHIPKKKQKEIMKPGIALNGQSGLGLHICNLWCKKIGALIKLESSKVATEFTIIFPKSFTGLKKQFELENKSQAEQEKDIFIPIASKKNIAIIDDIETFRMSLRNELNSLGFLVETFEDIDQFLDDIKHRKNYFSTVIVDRHGNGFDAAKDRFPESCMYYNFDGEIILYSSNVDKFQLEFYFELGFDKILSKSLLIDWRKELAPSKPREFHP